MILFTLGNNPNPPQTHLLWEDFLHEVEFRRRFWIDEVGLTVHIFEFQRNGLPSFAENTRPLPIDSLPLCFSLLVHINPHTHTTRTSLPKSPPVFPASTNVPSHPRIFLDHLNPPTLWISLMVYVAVGYIVPEFLNQLKQLMLPIPSMKYTDYCLQYSEFSWLGSYFQICQCTSLLPTE